MCDTLSSSAANLGDNSVSVAQGGTATPGATKQLGRYYVCVRMYSCVSMLVYVLCTCGYEFVY